MRGIGKFVFLCWVAFGALHAKAWAQGDIDEGVEELVSLDGGNASRVLMQGDNNGYRKDLVSQRGEGNVSSVAIIGSDNNFTVKQRSNGAINQSGVLQEGAGNRLSVNQKAKRLQDGYANKAHIHQLGNDNFASINQVAVESGYYEFSNISAIQQVGSGNIATTKQSGARNKAIQVQEGDDNISHIIQHGDENYAVHLQFGDDLSLPKGHFKKSTIEQFGGAGVIVVQCSAGC